MILHERLLWKFKLPKKILMMHFDFDVYFDKMCAKQ